MTIAAAAAARGESGGAGAPRLYFASHAGAEFCVEVLVTAGGSGGGREFD